MATKTPGTVVGVFSDQEEARNATRALRDAGFEENQIGVASASGGVSAGGAGDDDDGSYVGEGAMAGVATGAGIGALWGLGILAGVLPAIGPAIAGGTLAVLLSSAAAGAAAAGLAGALMGMGVPKEDAEYYEGEMKAGRTIVTVNAGDRRDEALQIIRQFGGYDRTSDSAARTSGATVGAVGMAGRDRGGSDTVQAREEQLRVQKTPVEKGEVKISKVVRTEHETVDVPVTREEVVVERRPASGEAVSASDLGEGEEIRIPVREEQVNVDKQAVVVEEVSVGKRRVQDTKHIDETLRKEEIHVDTEGDVDVRDRRS